MTDEDLADVVRLELRLLDPGVRARPDLVETLLHPDFVEYGASGRIWDRTATIAALARHPGRPDEPDQLTPTSLGSDVVLVTYRVPGAAGSLRSSLWVRDPETGWRLRFHQGTRSPSEQRPT